MKRIYFLDNLRALAILMVIFGHALLPYISLTLSHSLVRSNVTFHFLNYIAYCFHFLSMPIFFVLAGLFCHASLQKHSLAIFINEKLLRLGVPLLVGFIIFLPIHYIFYIQNFWALLTQFLQTQHGTLNSTQIFAHIFLETLNNGSFFKIFFHPEYLWFLLYLLIFSFVSIICYRYCKCLACIDDLFNKYSALPAILILAFLFTSGTSVLILMPNGIIPTWQSLLVYGFFFYYGWCLHKHPGLLTSLKSRVGIYFVFSIISLLAYLYTISNNPSNLNTWLISVTHAFALFLSINTIFGLFYRFANSANPILRYISDASYWIYLINTPTLIIFGMVFVNRPMSVLSQYCATITCAFFVFIITYELLVKRTRLKSFYLGKHHLKLMRPWINRTIKSELS